MCISKEDAMVKKLSVTYNRRSSGRLIARATANRMHQKITYLKKTS